MNKLNWECLEIQVELYWQLNWYDIWELGGGIQHILIWDFWSDVQTWVGTPHKVENALEFKIWIVLHTPSIITLKRLPKELGDLCSNEQELDSRQFELMSPLSFTWQEICKEKLSLKEKANGAKKHARCFILRWLEWSKLMPSTNRIFCCCIFSCGATLYTDSFVCPISVSPTDDWPFL